MPVGHQVRSVLVDHYKPGDGLVLTDFLGFHHPFYHFPLKVPPDSDCSPFVELTIVIDPTSDRDVYFLGQLLDITLEFPDGHFADSLSHIQFG